MPDQFTPAFQSYAFWRNKSGTFIKVVKFSDINASSADASCSTSIKPYIKNAYDTWKYRPSHVLLVGDAGVFPQMKWNSATEGTYKSINTTDAYYGETDSSNFHEPEILVGRLCVKDSAEMVDLLKKIMNYERNPPVTDKSWFKRMLGISSNQVVSGEGSSKPTYQVETVREVAQMQKELGYTADTLMCSNEADVSLDDVINSINKGCTFINYRGQGWAPGWVTPCYQFYTDKVPKVQNAGMLPFITGIGCGISMFDVTPSGTTGVSECFSEVLMRLGTPTAPRGIIAVFAPTGETHSYWNNAMDKGIYKGMLYNNLWSPGHATICAIDAMYKSDLNRDTTDYLSRLYLVLGDPATRLWKDVPQRATITGPTKIPLGTSSQTFAVKIGDVPAKNTQVCVSGELGDSVTYSTGFTDSSGSVTLSIEVPKDGILSLVAWGENIFPVEQNIAAGSAGIFNHRSENSIRNISLSTRLTSPFSSNTIISYMLPETGFTNLDVFSLQGSHVRTIISGVQSAGAHTIVWNGLDKKGMNTAQGIYLISLRQSNNITHQQITKLE
jgi:hypothetical protein